MFRRSFQTFLVFSVGLIPASLNVGKVFADSDSRAAALDTTLIHSVDPGQTAPDFKLLSQEGIAVSLKDYRGHWVVLYFYPKDFSRGCTIEAHNFQLDIREYEAANAVLLGVSVGSVGSHRDFCTKEGLNFKLLADTAATVSTRYGSVHHWYGRTRSARNTFLINPDGVVARAFIGVQPGPHSKEVLAALKEFQK